MKLTPSARWASETPGSSAIRMDVHLRRLVHRPSLLTDVLLLREQAALTALSLRGTDSTRLFGSAIDGDLIANSKRVLQRRLDRLTPAEVNADTAALGSRTRIGLWDREDFAAEAQALRDLGLGPLPVAAAQLFDQDAVELAPALIAELKTIPLSKFRAFVEKLAAQGEATLVQAAVHVLLQQADEVSVRNVRAMTELLLANVSFGERECYGLRGLADACWLLRRRRDELAVLQLIMLLGDPDFVADRYERMPLQATLNLVALAPASLVWIDSEFHPAKEIAFNADLVVVDAMLPPVMRRQVSPEALFTPRSVTGQQSGAGQLVGQYCPPYSVGESILSLRTEQLASRLAAAFAEPFRDTELAPLVPLLNEIGIRIDDVLFAALLPVFALELALGKRKPRTLALLTDQLSFANQAARAAARLAPECRVRATVLRPGDGVSEDLGREDPAELIDLVRDTKRFLETYDLYSAATETEPLEAADATLFCGRPFDRNYITDLRAFAPHALANADAHLLLTTPSRMKDGRLPTLAEVLPDSANMTIWADAETLSRTLSGRSIPESLKDHGANIVTACLADRDEPLWHLLPTAEPQLRRLLERSLPAMIISAALVRKMIRVARPSRLICLPGRDWLSRMAIAEARERLGEGVRSFDIQTVFVGPRMRYKPTTCDIQIAIETHSASVYEKSFGLAKEQIVIGGSPRYAASLSAGLDALQTPREPGDHYLVLFTASPIMERCLPVIAAVRDALVFDPRAVLQVRPHPSSGPADLVRLKTCIKAMGERGSVDNRLSLPSALARADVIVTRFSNTGLEAAMLGKDVIAADFTSEPPPVPLGDMGVAIAVNSAKALSAALRDIKTGGPLSTSLRQSRDAYLASNPLLQNERAAETLWNYIASGP